MYNHGKTFLNILREVKPKKILEIGVFTGVNARNICETLRLFHCNDFKYVGLDLFEDYTELFDNEISPSSIRKNKQKFSNPFKHIYYNLIKREQLNSYKSVESFLKKFKENITLIKGDTKKTLKELNLSEIDMCYIDGGHSYETVYYEANFLLEKTKKECLLLFDDYNHEEAKGVKQALDKVSKEKNIKLSIIEGRFAKFLR